METPKNQLDFARPPVDEVVLSVLFQSLDKLMAPHLGEIWQEFKNDGFINITEHAQVPPAIETFPIPSQRSGQFQFNVPDLARIWFIHENDNQIIQIQRDRFTHNWRRTDSDQKYPGFSTICDKFNGFYNRFCQIIKDMGIGEVTPLQYELTYIDQIRQGEGWNTLNDIGKIYNLFANSQNSDSFWSGVESLVLRTSFRIVDLNSRLYLTIRDRTKIPEEIQTLQTDFTMRGFPENLDCSTMTWFKLAREEIRKKFAMLFTEDIQTQVWKRR
jgi:uncharacterized protein (TIGR04255 family)